MNDKEIAAWQAMGSDPHRACRHRAARQLAETVIGGIIIMLLIATMLYFLAIAAEVQNYG